MIQKKALIEGLKKASKPMDAMKINDKYYCMIAVGMGYDSLVMKQTSRKMKRRWGIFAYVWTILKTIFFYRARSYKLNIDGKEEIINCKAVMTFNILPFGETKLAHYFMGTKVLANDGTLNMVALNPKPLLDPFFSSQMKVFSGKKISIQQKKSSTFHIDGDIFKNKIVTIEILPKVIYIAH